MGKVYADESYGEESGEFNYHIPQKAKKRTRPALTVEARQNQLISKAIDLAEKQLEEGTASSQIITHYLKLGTVQAQVELEKLKRENELLSAKTEALRSAKVVEELYRDAIVAMRQYQGVSEVVEDDEGY